MDRREEEEVIDLGIASVDTHGSDQQVIEGATKRKVLAGISED